MVGGHHEKNQCADDCPFSNFLHYVLFVAPVKMGVMSYNDKRRVSVAMFDEPWSLLHTGCG